MTFLTTAVSMTSWASEQGKVTSKACDSKALAFQRRTGAWIVSALASLERTTGIMTEAE